MAFDRYGSTEELTVEDDLDRTLQGRAGKGNCWLISWY
jgi:hypothetical protein